METLTAFALFLIIAVNPVAGILMAIDIDNGYEISLYDEDLNNKMLM